MESVKVVPNIIRALGTIQKRIEEYLRNINAGIELAALNSKNSVSGISKVVCSRRSDRGDTTNRCEKKKKKHRGGGLGVKAKERVLPSLPPYFFFFSRSLPSRRTPLSERLEQDISKDPPRILGGGLLRHDDGTEISGIDTPAV